MTFNKLKTELSKLGDIHIIKEAFVFTLLMTGKDMSKGTKFMNIYGLVAEYTKEKYPVVECIKNENDFVCMVLKPVK